MTECFVGAYAGWSVQTWIFTAAATATLPGLFSIPFWINRDRGWGVAAILSFGVFMSIHGAVQCVPAMPYWMTLAIALVGLVVIVVLAVVLYSMLHRPVRSAV